MLQAFMGHGLNKLFVGCRPFCSGVRIKYFWDLLCFSHCGWCCKELPFDMCTVYGHIPQPAHIL